MEHVDSAIAEVELEIKNAESKAEAADSTGNPETASYWRTEKQQLREKERQLREDKRQLREKELLILRTSGLQAPSPVPIRHAMMLFSIPGSTVFRRYSTIAGVLKLHACETIIGNHERRSMASSMWRRQYHWTLVYRAKRKDWSSIWMMLDGIHAACSDTTQNHPGGSCCSQVVLLISRAKPLPASSV